MEDAESGGPFLSDSDSDSSSDSDDDFEEFLDVIGLGGEPTTGFSEHPDTCPKLSRVCVRTLCLPGR